MRYFNNAIHLLKKIGIASTVIANRSVICNPKSPSTCYVEYGCDIRLNNLNPLFIKSKVWKPLKKEFNFSCAYLNIPGQYQGCIHDFQNSRYHENN